MDRLGLGSLEVNGDSALIASLGDDLTRNDTWDHGAIKLWISRHIMARLER